MSNCCNLKEFMICVEWVVENFTTACNNRIQTPAI